MICSLPCPRPLRAPIPFWLALFTLAMLAGGAFRVEPATAAPEDVEMAGPRQPGTVLVTRPDGSLDTDAIALPPNRFGWDGEAVQSWDISRYLAHHKAAALEREQAIETGELGRVPTANQDRWDQTYFDIQLTLDPSVPTISSAVTTMRATVLDGPLTEVELDFQDNLSISGITSDGNTTTWSRADDILTVDLDRSYANGEEIEVAVSYSGTPISSAFYFDSFAGSPMVWTLSQPYGARTWWPSKDWPSDKPEEVDIRITAPSGNRIVSNGVLVSEIDNGLTSTAHWNESYPIATYLVHLGVYPYSVSTGSYESIGGETVDLVFYDFPSEVGNNAAGNAIVDDMLAVYEGLFGEYPYPTEKYGHNQSLFGGGMEHQTCSSIGIYFESLIAHEATHQWWGDLVTCETYNHVWLNEGFATYGEALWLEEAYGQEAYLADMLASQYFGPGTVYVEDPSSFGAIFNSNLSYNKGSWVLHMLRHVLGDTNFFATLAQYRDDFAYSSATTEDFQAVAETVSGQDLNAFFQQWIYGEGYPIYQFEWTGTPDGPNWTIDLQVDQLQSSQIFEMPIDVVVTTTAGTESFVVDSALASEAFQLTVSAEPTKVELDPDNWILRQVFAPIPEPTFTRDILLYNGVSWSTYGAEILDAYEARAFWGDFGIDFWDFFDEPSGGYPSTLPAPRGHGPVPGEILAEYEHVIWVGNNFQGDLTGWVETPIYSYLQAGGNVLLLSRFGDQFLNEVYEDYLGVDLFSSSTAMDCIAVEPGFTDIGRTGTQSFTVPFETIVGPNTTLLYEGRAGYVPDVGLGAVVEPPAGGEFNPNGGRFAHIAGRPYRWNSVDLRENVMRILETYFGKSVSDAPEPQADALRFGITSVEPNPFGGSAEMRFALPSAGDVQVDVIDVAGRRVRSLIDGPMEAGRQTLHWDGRDDAGTSVSSGVYFLRLRLDGREDQMKVLRMR